MPFPTYEFVIKNYESLISTEMGRFKARHEAGMFGFTKVAKCISAILINRRCDPCDDQMDSIEDKAEYRTFPALCARLAAACIVAGLMSRGVFFKNPVITIKEAI